MNEIRFQCKNFRSFFRYSVFNTNDKFVTKTCRIYSVSTDQLGDRKNIFNNALT